MTLNVGQQAPVESADVTSVVVRRFVPDFVIGERNEIQSRSEDPTNPAALVEAWKGEERVFSGWISAKYPDFGQGHGNDPMSGARKAAAADAPKISVVLKDYSAAPYSVLEAAKDPGVNLIWLGCLLVSGGFFLAFYWPPREIRVVLEGSQGKVDLAAGGQAAKSREAFQAEFDKIFESDQEAGMTESTLFTIAFVFYVLALLVYFAGAFIPGLLMAARSWSRSVSWRRSAGSAPTVPPPGGSFAPRAGKRFCRS